MKKIIRLTESQLVKLVKKVINEDNTSNEFNINDRIYVPKQDMIYKVKKTTGVGVKAIPLGSKDKGDEMEFNFDEIEKLFHEKIDVNGNIVELNKDKDYGWVIVFPQLDVENQIVEFDDEETARKNFGRVKRLLEKGHSIEDVHSTL